VRNTLNAFLIGEITAEDYWKEMFDREAALCEGLLKSGWKLAYMLIGSLVVNVILFIALMVARAG
jgi:hypothetical protein